MHLRMRVYFKFSTFQCFCFQQRLLPDKDVGFDGVPFTSFAEKVGVSDLWSDVSSSEEKANLGMASRLQVLVKKQGLALRSLSHELWEDPEEVQDLSLRKTGQKMEIFISPMIKFAIGSNMKLMLKAITFKRTIFKNKWGQI